MTTNQLSPAETEGTSFSPEFWERTGWGLGVSMITRRVGVSEVPGRFGWDGGYGTSWASDPKEQVVAILMTQRLWTSPSPPDVYLDFWTSAYQAIDD
jgi:CubicO group peptidase (beta-lactamase class C family)